MGWDWGRFCRFVPDDDRNLIINQRLITIRHSHMTTQRTIACKGTAIVKCQFQANLRGMILTWGRVCWIDDRAWVIEADSWWVGWSGNSRLYHRGLGYGEGGVPDGRLYPGGLG